VSACPIGSIYFNDELNVAQKCTGCAHLLDNGWEVPRCVDACPHEAIQFKEEEEFGALLSKAECLEPLNGLGSRAYYLHLPQRFVAGTAVDFAADEVVIDARVDIAGIRGFTASKETDELGDFKFDQIPPDTYKVTIIAEGYKMFETEADLREGDLSLDDLSLER
jgi:NAD-dependent dihydropyrimidine dehydrogenase PreA subunit